MVTVSDVKAIILREVGDRSGLDLADQIDTAWDSFADKALVGPRLQELYTKRRLIDFALGSVRDLIDEATEGTSARNEQRLINLIDLRTETEAEIGVVEERVAANRAPATGLITKVAPVSAPGPAPSYPFPDLNDMRYSGSPYQPPGWPPGVL